MKTNRLNAKFSALWQWIRAYEQYGIWNVSPERYYATKNYSVQLSADWSGGTIESHDHREGTDMLHYKVVPTILWAKAVVNNDICNMFNHTAHEDSTLYELGFKVKPRREYLFVFGSKKYAYIDDAKRTKLESKRFRRM